MNRPKKQILMVAWLAGLCFQACTVQTENNVQSVTPELPSFDPDYFRYPAQHYYSVMIKFKDNTFQLAREAILKMPGKPPLFINQPSGKFKIFFKDAAEAMLDTLITASPIELHAEEYIYKLKEKAVYKLDSISFFVPLPKSGLTKSIRLEILNELVVDLKLPIDTIDLISLNRKAVPDTSVFSPGK